MPNALFSSNFSTLEHSFCIHVHFMSYSTVTTWLMCIGELVRHYGLHVNLCGSEHGAVGAGISSHPVAMSNNW